MSRATRLELSELECFHPQVDGSAFGRREQDAAFRALMLEERLAYQTALANQRGRQLNALADELIAAEQQERSQLAADLHDYLAQLLVACHMHLGAAMMQPGGETPLLKEAADLLKQSLAYTRTLVTELSPANLCEAGLGEAIRWLAEQMLQQGLHVCVHEEGTEFAVPEQHAMLVFRSVRELLFNIVKHAGVRTATISIRSFEGRVSIVVEDRGEGSDRPLTECPRDRQTGFGLNSIRQRLAAIGGGFEITSAPREGTRASIWIPSSQVETGQQRLT